MSTEPRIYVACLASYNAGRLHGAWIDATTDVDAMAEEVAAMLRASPCPNVRVAKDDESRERVNEIWPRLRTMSPDQAGGSTYRALFDEWMSLTVPSAEEWAIHDSEGLGSIGEYAGLAEVARRVAIIEAAEERDIPPAVLIEAMGELASQDDDPVGFIDDYYDGTAESWEAFATEFHDSCGDIDQLPEWVRSHVDWESIGRDWELGGEWSAFGLPGELYFFRTR